MKKSIPLFLSLVFLITFFLAPSINAIPICFSINNISLNHDFENMKILADITIDNNIHTTDLMNFAGLNGYEPVFCLSKDSNVLKTGNYFIEAIYPEIGKRNVTIYINKAECQLIEESFQVLDKGNERQLTVRAVLYNPYNSTLYQTLKMTNNEPIEFESTTILGDSGNIALERLLENDFMISPYTSVILNSKFIQPREIMKRDGIYIFAISSSIKDNNLVPNICSSPKNIKYRLNLPLQKGLFSKLSIEDEQGLEPLRVNQIDENLVYIWEVKDNQQIPIIIKYRYIIDWSEIIVALIFIIIGLIILPILRYSKDRYIKLKQSDILKSHLKVFTSKK